MCARMLPCSIKEFSETVDLLYDCALEPEHWRRAVRKIAEIADSPSSSLGVLDVKSGDSHSLYDQGYRRVLGGVSPLCASPPDHAGRTHATGRGGYDHRERTRRR